MDPGSTTGQDERYELASEAKPSLHTWCSDQPEGTLDGMGTTWGDRAGQQ